MNSVWGRRESKGWPSRTPNYTITALMIALASAILTGCCRYYFIWTPLERHYLREYFLTGLMARLGAKTDRYDVLTVITRKNYRLAVDEDVAPFKTPSAQPRSRFPKTPGREADSVSRGCGSHTTTSSCTHFSPLGFTTARRLQIWQHGLCGWDSQCSWQACPSRPPGMPPACGNCATGDD